MRWLACLFLASCTATGGPDYEVIGRELELTSQDLTDLKVIAADDGDLVKLFSDLQEIVVAVNSAVATGESDSVLEAVRVGLLATEQILLNVADLSDKDRTYVSATIFVVRSVLRRIEAYSE